MGNFAACATTTKLPGVLSAVTCVTQENSGFPEESCVAMRPLALDPCRSRAFFASLGLTISLAACAGLPSNNEPDEAQRTSQTAQRTEDQVRAQRDVLIPWHVITGGRLATQVDANGFPVPGYLEGFTTFISPSALAVRGSDFYIADSGARKLYRFDSTLQTLSVVPDVFAMPWTRLQVGVDNSLFVLDAGSSTILHYTRGGRLLQTLSYPLTTARLTEFVVDESLGKIFAGDQLNRRLVVLHLLGQASRILDSTDMSEIAVLGAIAKSGRTIYALDLRCPCIVAMDDEGRGRERIGQGALIQPRTLAVDRHGQIFVADDADRTLKVFLQGALIASYGAQALGITEISALAVDEGFLYISDGPGARVITLRILPPDGVKQ